MTLIKLFSQNGNYKGFEISGHSDDNACKGTDIVCAAISSCSIMVVNTVTEIIGDSAEPKVDDGYLKFLVSENFINKSQDLLKGFALHVTELSKEYPDNLKVTLTEV